jgi:hypothetical protein
MSRHWQVAYRDDFGVPRGKVATTALGTIHALIGRAIRAPFAGLAVAHTDDWFGVCGLVGAEVRSQPHLSRFAHLGYVRAGAVIGTPDRPVTR